MGAQKCRIVGKSQSVLIMIDPIIFTRTRNHTALCGHPQMRRCAACTVTNLAACRAALPHFSKLDAHDALSDRASSTQHALFDLLRSGDPTLVRYGCGAVYNPSRFLCRRMRSARRWPRVMTHCMDTGAGGFPLLVALLFCRRALESLFLDTAAANPADRRRCRCCQRQCGRKVAAGVDRVRFPIGAHDELKNVGRHCGLRRDSVLPIGWRPPDR
jgi:hypothetical protein